MTYAIRVRARARVDLDDISRWYESQRTGLGGRFVDEVETVFAHLSEQPFLYVEIYRGARRAVLQSFPFGVYYRVVGTVISLVAVMHSSRHPREWMRRA